MSVVSSSSSKGGGSTVVLVTGPRWYRDKDDDGIVKVENERCQTIRVIDSSSPQRRTVLLRESSFGAERKNKEMEERELEERPISIISPCDDETTENLKGGGAIAAAANFDVCREYGYKYEYTVDEEDDDDNDDNVDHGDNLLNPYTMDVAIGCGSVGSSMQPVSSSRTRESGSLYNFIAKVDDENDNAGAGEAPIIYLLGKSYHSINDHAPRRDDETSLFWFTYRCDFPEIVPYKITSDAGWGCMLRSAQMLLAHALRMHYQSGNRSWRPSQSIASRRSDPFMRNILTWFADFPSTTECFYSLHNMVATGLAKYEKLPGEWYGPGIASYVIRDLVQVHERYRHEQQKQQRKSTASGNTTSSAKQQPMLEKQLFRVHVAQQGSLYKDSVRDLMTHHARSKLEKKREKEEKKKSLSSSPTPLGSGDSFLHPLALEHNDASSNNKEVESSSLNDSLEWDTALLLLIPLRLGLKTFNENYQIPLAFVFSLPQCVGVLGGRPRGARWFYGATSDGNKVYGLDPHTVQYAPARLTANANGHTSSMIQISEDYIRSIHTTYPEVFPMEKMDPSIALGFYCQNQQEFHHLIRSIEEWNRANPTLPDLFSIADTLPDYSANDSNVMKEMMLSSSLMASDNMDMPEDMDDEIGDEDEYVLL